MLSLILDPIKDTGTGDESSGHLVKCFLDLSELRDTLEKPDKSTGMPTQMDLHTFSFLFNINVMYLFLSR